MIRRYKILKNFGTLDAPRPEPTSKLINQSGYLVYDNASITPNQLVDENNVIQYLENPDNAKVTNAFVEYLRNALTPEEFEFIYTKPYKVYPLLNNYYEQKVKLNEKPSEFLLYYSLLSTKNVEFKDNNFDYETKERINKSLNKLIQVNSGSTELEIQYETQGSPVDGSTYDVFQSAGQNFELTSGDTQDDYYLYIQIDQKIGQVLSTDYSKYYADCIEDGVVLKNCFVDLNKKTDPFEVWTDNFFNSTNKQRGGLSPAKGSKNSKSSSRRR